MDERIWGQIIDDIERNLDRGEGYTLNIRTKSGDRWNDFAWARVNLTKGGVSSSVIVFSKPDTPPVYLPFSAIESVELAS